MVGVERLLRRFPGPVWQWLIVAGGVALRLLFFAREGWVPLLRGESVLIALSVAQNGTYANAYGGNSGPTAHCMPLYPLWQALLIRIFGAGPEGRYAIAFFSALAACIGFALFPRLAERAGLGWYAGLFAGLLGAFLPFNFFPQTEGGFETSFAFLAIVLLLLLWLKVRKDEEVTWRAAVIFGVAIGVAGLLSAVLLPVVAVWLLLPMASKAFPDRWRREWLRFAVTAGVSAGVVFAPWVVRNEFALGSPVLTRSNFGLEVYKSNYDGASPILEVAVQSTVYQARGPFASESERAKVRSMGEVAYNAEKLALTKLWVRQHPQQFAVLTLQRIRYFWFPSMVRMWQTIGEALITTLGVGGAFFLGLRGTSRRLALLSLVVFVVYPLPYYITAASWRYRFPLEGLLIFWAGAWVAGVKLAGRKSATAQPNSA